MNFHTVGFNFTFWKFLEHSAMLSFRSITSKISISNWRFLENIKFHEISQIFRNVGHALKLNAHTHSSMHCYYCCCLVPMAGLAFSPSMVFMQFWGKKSVGREFNFMKNSCLMHISDISWIIYSQNFSVKYSIKEA